jgi:ribosomal protein L11 methyltransferase
VSSPGRRWLELRARSSAPPDRGALIADALLGLGARGVEERSGWYVAYFEEPEAGEEAFVATIARGLELETRLTDIRLETAWQDHEDWADSWKRGLGVRRITDRIVVRPSWIEPSDRRPGDVVVTVDPGMAFGTAEHGTTRGCLRLLDGAVREGDRILDVGAGSGILAIAASLLGAGSVVAVEGDALACEALRENVVRNEVGGTVVVEQAWASADSLAERQPVDGIIANIESGLLIPLFEGFAAALSEGAWLIVSGILVEEWDDVERMLAAAGFTLGRVDTDEGWRSALLTRAELTAHTATESGTPGPEGGGLR